VVDDLLYALFELLQLLGLKAGRSSSCSSFWVSMAPSAPERQDAFELNLDALGRHFLGAG
jgi:hypothetical protein